MVIEYGPWWAKQVGSHGVLKPKQSLVLFMTPVQIDILLVWPKRTSEAYRKKPTGQIRQQYFAMYHTILILTLAAR